MRRSRLLKGGKEMRSTGLVRQLDELGRLVVPSELRHSRRLEKGDPVEIFVQGDLIILRKYEPTCVFCGKAQELVSQEGKRVCKQCRGLLKDAEPKGKPGGLEQDVHAG